MSFIMGAEVNNSVSPLDLGVSCESNCSEYGLYTTMSPVNITLGNYWLPWWQQTIFITIFVAMFLVAAGGNIIVIWIVLAHKRMRTVTNFFLVNLAVADALISILNTLFNTVFLLYQDWWFGKNFCKFDMFIAPCTISASVFTFIAIAIDRYMAIVHPLRPRLTAKIVLAVIFLIWLASVIIALPMIIYAEIQTYILENGDSRTVCLIVWPDGVQKTTDFVYNIFLMIMNYFLPMIVLGVTYSCVAMELWGSKTIGEDAPMQRVRMKSKRKVVKMLIAVVVIFGICWLPYHVYFLLTFNNPAITDYEYIQQIFLLIYWLAMSNSMYNPIIYCLMNARFRQGFKYVFRCTHCVRYRVSGNHLKLGGVTMTVRTSLSVSDNTKYDRNGSMMHTMVDNVDDTSVAPTKMKMLRKKAQDSDEDYALDENYL